MNRRAAVLVLLIGAAAAWLVVGLIQTDTRAQRIAPDASRPTDETPDPASAPLLGTLVETQARTPTAEERALQIDVHDGANPIANASVFTLRSMEPDLVVPIATTNASGRVRVVLPKNSYSITITAPGFLSRERMVLHAATRMRVRLWKSPKTMVVAVQDKNGRGLDNAFVTVQSDQAGLFEWKHGDARGRVRIPIHAFGLLHVIAIAPGFLPKTIQVDGADIDDDWPTTMRLWPIPLITSQVLDGVSREPLADVDITDGVSSTTSDGEGHFSFQPVRAQVRLSLDGYYLAKYPLRRHRIPSEYFLRKTRSPNEHAPRDASDTISGHVTNADGSPATELVVFGRTGRATTDEKGRFEFPGLPNSLRVLHDTWDLQVIGALRATTDIRLPPLGRLAGRVVFPEGVPRCAVSLFFGLGTGPEITAAAPAHGFNDVQQRTPDGGTKYVPRPNIWSSSIVKQPLTMDAHGHFAMEDIPVGTYLLNVTPEPDSVLLFQQVQVQVRAEAVPVDVLLRAGETLRVRVLDHLGKVIPGALVAIPGDGGASQYADAKGEAAFEGLHPVEQFIYVQSELGRTQTKGMPGSIVVVQYEPRPMLTMAMTRQQMPDGTACTVELSEVDGRGIHKMKGRVVNGEVRARLPALDLAKSYEVGIKCKTHWSPWTPLSLSADGSMATASARVFLDEEEEED